MREDIDGLRRAIRQRYGSVHVFCQANPALKRATVYLVLSGKYPGNLERQAAKIEAALTGKAALEVSRQALTAREAFEVLQGAKCAHCRRLDKRGCPECQTQTMREAQALEDYLRPKEGT
ncbi:MAG: hypothetical protein LBD82_00930 [Deltaproteobacteria bacterium]|nr:hypothetical protein [Deltaproteobacteria bacterium]